MANTWRFLACGLLWPALLAVASLAASGSDTPLIDAAKNGDGATVLALLEDGVDVNAPQGDGATALHWAVHLSDRETTDALIEAGANVNAANDLGVTPLWLACLNGDAPAADQLLTAGASANVVLQSGETALMTAARTGNVDVVKLLLAHGADANAKEGSQGQTALMWAVSQRHSNVVKTLIDSGADVHARTDIRHRRVNTETSGFGREILDEVDLGGFTPLLFAARTGDLDAARFLLDAGASARDIAPEGSTALMVAAHSGNGAVAALLLERGADPNVTAAGYTALHAAVMRGDLELVRALLSSGADPNARVTKGTPVRRASVDYGISGYFIGASPLWLAARHAEPEIMRLLGSAGADVPTESEDGTTLLQAALQGRRRAEVGITVDQAEAEERVLIGVTVALDLGSDVNRAGAGGNTPLHTAALRQLDSLVQLFVERGASLEAENDSNQTPLALVRSPDASTAVLLKELGATK